MPKITPDNSGKIPPAGLRGEVTAVPRPDVVEISLGADDGVRKGHQFVVTRPSTGKYIGMIEVIQVDYPNRAVCRPDKATAKRPDPERRPCRSVSPKPAKPAA